MKPTVGRTAALTLLLAPTLVACATRDDDYVLLRRTAAAGDATHLQLAAKNDPEAHYLRHLLANGFGAELMRTYAMTKRFAAHTSGYRDTETTIGLGRPDTPAGSSGAPALARRVQIGWWKTKIAADAPIIWIDDSPARGARSSMADLVSGFGGAIVDVIAPETGAAHARSAPLRDGYVAFLQVVGSEWRPPRDTDDRDELRRSGVVAHVRANDAVLAARDIATVCHTLRDCPPPQTRPAQEMIADRLVVASVLYRLASSELGQKMADPGVYTHFLEARPPKDIHPALLLGAFRNFQAKLLAAWSRASMAGRPPHDIVDLIEAYADAYPAERAEATRIFLVTTLGATAIASGVRTDETPDRVEAQLAVLTADVLFGRRGLRDGFQR